jgi:hypothetical protein
MNCIKRKGVIYMPDIIFAWEHHRKAAFSLKEGWY